MHLCRLPPNYTASATNLQFAYFVWTVWKICVSCIIFEKSCTGHVVPSVSPIRVNCRHSTCHLALESYWALGKVISYLALLLCFATAYRIKIALNDTQWYPFRTQGSLCSVGWIPLFAETHAIAALLFPNDKWSTSIKSFIVFSLLTDLGYTRDREIDRT